MTCFPQVSDIVDNFPALSFLCFISDTFYHYVLKVTYYFNLSTALNVLLIPSCIEMLSDILCIFLISRNSSSVFVVPSTCLHHAHVHLYPHEDMEHSEYLLNPIPCSCHHLFVSGSVCLY